MDIEIKNLYKSFGDQVVFQNFSAKLKKGQVTCLMGPSGAGKTTLLNILMGLMQPDSGEIVGVPAKKSAVFQEERLCESFSAVANVRLVCSKKTSYKISNKIIEDHLSEIGLDDSLYKPVRELSGGMRRRVSIVRAVLADRDVLFLDEPFKGLDEATKKTVMEYTKTNTQNKTVVMITHDPDEAKAMCQEAIYIKKGETANV
ncbi:MAG: ATP-binding cassette domain-containing protein [Clostridia bacterium]|jgi:NitT/TauT family transport system ATP-binding protein|nr:ATP-binding cassette domain-containing protein [Clostridia bacterium]